MSAPLEREAKTYEEKKTELLANSAGKYVVIHGDQVAGVWTPRTMHCARVMSGSSSIRSSSNR